jgi:lipoate-protein ligase A
VTDETFTIQLNSEDRPFLDEEALRIMQERFAETRELERPSLADVVTALPEELRRHRRHAERCPHRSREREDADTRDASETG